MKRMQWLTVAVVAAICGMAWTSAWAWEIVTTDRDAFVLSVTNESAGIVKGNYVFWGADYKWAGANATYGAKADKQQPQPFTLKVDALGITADGTIASAKPEEVVYTYNFNVAAPLTNISGGGIQFDLALQSEGLKGFRADPELLPGKTGWKWEVAKGEFVQVAFEPAVKDVYFERGNKNTVRAMFFGGDVPAGKSTVTMKVTLPKGSIQAMPTAERYGVADPSKWFVGALDPQKSFIDMSFLNEKPAGKHGFVQAKGDQFVFDDGTPIRFWGGNVQAYSVFVHGQDGSTNKALIDTQAKRIAAMGFNLIRLHHMDSGGWVQPNLIAQGPTSQEMNAAALDTYFYWIKALKENGVYVWSDLHVGRMFTAGDEIPGFEDMAGKDKDGKVKDAAEGKGYCYLSDRITQLMKDFDKKLVTTVNPYTQLAIKDDPAVMGMLLTNENDLTGHFGNLFLGDKGHPFFQKIFEERLAEFAKKTNLPAADLNRTWEAGPSKLFLNDLEYHWCADMIKNLRDIGVKVPVTSGHMWGMSLYSIAAQTAGNMIDMHDYTGAEFLSGNPRMVPNFALYFASNQLVDHPVTITEYNSDDPPATDDFTIPLYIAGIGAFQGWDAPMIYGYSQDGLGGESFSSWSSYDLPQVMGLNPAAALVFRSGQVQGAKETKVVQLTRETAFLKDNNSGNSRALRTLAETHRLVVALPAVPELDWLKASAEVKGAEVVTDLTKDFIPEGQNFVQSDTGELRRDWEKGVFTIDAPKCQAVSGWMKGEKMALKDVTFEIGTPKATVALNSLDDKPLAESAKILLSTAARAQKAQNQPIKSEPVIGKVSLKSKVAGLKLVPLGKDGAKMAAVASQPVDGVYTWAIPDNLGTHWFLLTSE